VHGLSADPRRDLHDRLLFFEQTRLDRVPFRCSAGSFRLAGGDLDVLERLG
jgi:hypothetical protein